MSQEKQGGIAEGSDHGVHASQRADIRDLIRTISRDNPL